MEAAELFAASFLLIDLEVEKIGFFSKHRPAFRCKKSSLNSD